MNMYFFSSFFQYYPTHIRSVPNKNPKALKTVCHNEVPDWQYLMIEMLTVLARVAKTEQDNE